MDRSIGPVVHGGSTLTSVAPIQLRPDTLTGTVFETLRDYILDATLPPGCQVTEATLSQRLQVSKTPVREALLRLRHMGLVEPVGRSLQVINLSHKRIQDAYEYRAGMEATAARLAAERASTQTKYALVGLAEESVVSARHGRDLGFKSADMTFHSQIAAAADNPMLVGSVENLLALCYVLRRRDIKHPAATSDCAAEHIDIAAAISAGDSERASALAYDHVHHVLRLVMAAVGD
ncbi:DNA-binding GntR family transcriptional regulator [Rhodococcus rhodochrous J38]|uniref:GntR family transcriptional regulator n=1 Tax=Rhodococcus rhodochrous TaxID=1829 RepID=UPI0011A43D4C|nr:GntR family transcriptional regulator [Rhodococcus rhodochrous]TWH41966.1 DNA-binding GntR family transcriptional regulator [Rhodococcus rhodochrous J38]